MLEERLKGEECGLAAALRRSAERALAHPSGVDTRFWVIAPLYDGLLRSAAITGNAKYLAAVAPRHAIRLEAR